MLMNFLTLTDILLVDYVHAQANTELIFAMKIDFMARKNATFELKEVIVKRSEISVL